MKLTPKQEIFIQGIVSGKLSQREAYKKAYNTTRMKDKTIDEKASRLFNNDKVRTRYEEIIEEFKDKALYTREEADEDYEWIKQLSKKDILENGLRQANSSAYLNAIKGRCDLNDLWPAKKQDVVLNGNMEINNPFDGLTTEELRMIVAMEAIDE
ncbi:MAG: terminase small subunit [Cetobacterium sp.]